MHERNKWAFWAAALCAAAAILVPSSLLMDACRRYSRFVEGFEPPLLRPVRVRSVPHGGGGKEAETALEFVEFKVKAPEAEEVLLVGDFNAWKDGTLRLTKAGDSWELTLPLPRGRYRYLYLVDGRESLDPRMPAQDWRGRRVSLREVH